MPLFTLHIDCQESCFIGKPVMDLADLCQVHHEGGSGARPEVDHQGDAPPGHIQESLGLPSIWIMNKGVWSGTELSRCLKQNIFKI